jgi:DNA-binding MarR family transcriptional regulator
MVTDDSARSRLIGEVTAEFEELRQAADMLDEAVAAQVGLNRTDLRCLGSVYRRGRLTAGELAEESGLTPGAITTVLDRLERAGFANRVADPADRRRVLVVSTAAAREVGGRLYGEVEVASSAELAGHSAEELTVIRDYLRRLHDVYVSQAAHAAGPGGGPVAGAIAAGAEAGEPETWAPLGDITAGRLTFTKGAASVVIRGDAADGELYRARFEGPAPEVRVEGGAVTIAQKRRFRPFDWRGRSCEVALSAAVPWAVSLRGGMWQLRADLRALRLESLEVAGGASDVEIWLPQPTGTVPVRLSGGASQVRIHRPAAAALRAVLSGGASKLEFGDQQLGAIAGRNVLSTPGFDEATDRYEVRFSGGASQVTVDVA